MLGKLSLRNAKRSIQDYSIYSITITIAFTLIYAFNMIAFSKDLTELSSIMTSFQGVIIFVSCIVVLVIGWLVHYMNKFMLSKRSKELGTYMILGINNQSIAKLFLWENIIIGFISLIGGILAGTLLYQFLIIIIMHIFEAPYQVELTFSIKALGLTILYAILIYTFSLFCTKRKLKKMKIYDLLYAEKRNEEDIIKKTKGGWLLFFLSLIIGILGGILLHWTCHNNGNISISIILVALAFFIFSIYGFYICLSSVLLKIFVKNKKRSLKKDNLFLFRNLSAKMGTMSMTLGTLSVLFMLTLAAIENGMLFKGLFDHSVDMIAPVEISICNYDEKEDFTRYQDYIENHFTITSQLTYSIYTEEEIDFKQFLETNQIFSWGDKISIIKLSDYQNIRKMMGYDEISLQEENYLIQGPAGLNILNNVSVPNLTIGKTTLKYEKINTDPFPNGLDDYMIVVPDKACKDLESLLKLFLVNTKEQTTVQTNTDLVKLIKPMIEEDTNESFIPFYYVRVRGALLAESKSEYTILAFALFYVGLIFICVAATVLAVQQLSDASKYKYRYRILSNLGMEEKRIQKLIFKQILFYFGFPILLPIPISIFITYCVNAMMSYYIATELLFTSVTSSLVMFGFVYLLYFLVTYIGYRKNIAAK